LNHYVELYRTINKTFGFRLRPLGTFVALQVRQAMSSLTLRLDRIAFPGYRQQPIDRPIFIVGNPRSGTTFLHRLLLGAGDTAGDVLSDITNALLALGYNEREALTAMKGLPAEISVSDGIRAALKLLSKSS
jgi:hypothetical protein